MLQKLKELETEAEDYEEIVCNHIPQSDSDNINKSRDDIITNYTVIPVLICQTRYNSPTKVRSLVIPSRKKDSYNLKIEYD